MPVKKCTYCGERMTKVVYGLPREDEYENPPPFTEFAGCIFYGPSPDFYCTHCDSKIIKQQTPKEGVCLRELPEKQLKAIGVFANRVEMALFPLGVDPEQIQLSCIHDDLEPPMLEEDDLYVEMRFHELHGDALKVKLCDCVTVLFPIGGQGPIVRHFTEEDDDPWDIRSRVENHQSDPIPLNMSLDSLEELLASQRPLNALLDRLIYIPKCDWGCSGPQHHLFELFASQSDFWPARLDSKIAPADWKKQRHAELKNNHDEDSD